jgi:hypothetical protein
VAVQFSVPFTFTDDFSLSSANGQAAVEPLDQGVILPVIGVTYDYTAAIPEPSTISLACTGLMLAVCAVRQRRRAHCRQALDHGGRIASFEPRLTLASNCDKIFTSV